MALNILNSYNPALSLQVVNEEPIVGDPVNLSSDEVRHKAYGVFYTQTDRDWETLFILSPLRVNLLSKLN